MCAMHTALRLLPFALLAVAGCAEVQNGPRIVTLSNDRFDIRYVPPVDSRSDINELAEKVCAKWGGRQAELLGSAQYLPVDLRTSTYKCVPSQAASPGAPAPSSTVSSESPPAAHSG